MSFLSSLFSNSSNTENPSAWTQSQVEALVDLLYYAIYADSHLSKLEETKVEEELAKVEWAGATTSTLYINDAITRARDARDDPKFKAEYLANIAERIGKDSQPDAIKALENVLYSDGTDTRETEFLAEVKASFAA